MYNQLKHTTMKRLFILVIAIASTLTLSAKEVATNPDTDMTLSLNLGVYTLTGQNGAIVLGNQAAATKFFATATKAFAKETINNIFKCGDDQFEVLKDDQGLYIIKIGLGAVKIRPTDSVFFYSVLEAKSISTKAKEVWKVIKE